MDIQSPNASSNENGFVLLKFNKRGNSQRVLSPKRPNFIERWGTVRK